MGAFSPRSVIRTPLFGAHVAETAVSTFSILQFVRVVKWVYRSRRPPDAWRRGGLLPTYIQSGDSAGGGNVGPYVDNAGRMVKMCRAEC